MADLGSKLVRLLCLTSLALFCLLSSLAWSADLRVPANVEAGKAFSIPAEGSGEATFYLVGPDHAAKRTVTLGGSVQIESSEIRAAGRYQAILCGSSCSSATFEVKASQPARFSFFLHPSRVPVSMPDSVDATAFVFDQYQNLVVNPTSVDFRVTPPTGAGFSRQSPARNGVAWMRMNSTPHEGPMQITAVLGRVEETRLIQQVAAEACGLRIKATRNGAIVIVETDPVRDCSGNAVPDGTVISFTNIDQAGKSTVDTPIKKGVARGQFFLHGTARISVACGVVLGNELTLKGSL